MKAFSQGDIIWMDFNPQAGHEQAGRRPALVVSRSKFNATGALTMVVGHCVRSYQADPKQEAAFCAIMRYL